MRLRSCGLGGGGSFAVSIHGCRENCTDLGRPGLPQFGRCPTCVSRDFVRSPSWKRRQGRALRFRVSLQGRRHAFSAVALSLSGRSPTGPFPPHARETRATSRRAFPLPARDGCKCLALQGSLSSDWIFLSMRSRWDFAPPKGAERRACEVEVCEPERSRLRWAAAAQDVQIFVKKICKTPASMLVSDPACSNGLLSADGSVCCSAACGSCGGEGCEDREGQTDTFRRPRRSAGAASSPFSFARKSLRVSCLELQGDWRVVVQPTCMPQESLAATSPPPAS